MLTLTPEAGAALEALVDSPEVPDGSGFRLARGTGSDGRPAIGLTLVSEPEADDEVIETDGGVGIYVAADAAESLDDQELCAEMRGEQIAFSLRPQH
jgi:Fe-S cluster assembly iron-binding protein IscA